MVFYTEFTKVVDSFNEITNLDKKLGDLIDKTISDAKSGNETESPTIQQIHSLQGDIRSSISQANEIIGYCAKMESRLKLQMDRFSQGSAFPEELSEFNSKLPLMINTINSYGAVTGTKKVNLAAGINTTTISTTGLAQGFHVISISGAAKTLNLKLVVQ